MTLLSAHIPITSTTQLRELCDKISGDEFVCVDTEFHRERSYYADLCLVQVASASAEGLIDAVSSDIDLTPLYELLQDESILKVFHAASQDLEIFVHRTGRVPPNCYDTQIAASVCGYGQSISLARLVKSLLGKDADKEQQFSNWRMRPLGEQQCQYALSDVTLLRQIFPKIRQRIVEMKRETWIEQQMARLHEVSRYISDPEESWQKFSTARMSKRSFPVLKRIAAWREIHAQRLNVPRRHLLKDDTVTEIAQLQPTTESEIANLRSTKNLRLSREVMDSLLQAVAQGIENAPEEPPKPETINRQIRGDVSALLRLLLKDASRRSGVAASLIASSNDLDLMAGGQKDVPALSGWRHELFGEDALLIMAGKASIGIKNGTLKIVRTRSNQVPEQRPLSTPPTDLP